MSCVDRLKALWEKLEKKHLSMFKELELLFSPSKNHLNYQTAVVRLYVFLHFSFHLISQGQLDICGNS